MFHFYDVSLGICRTLKGTARQTCAPVYNRLWAQTSHKPTVPVRVHVTKSLDLKSTNPTQLWTIWFRVETCYILWTNLTCFCFLSDVCTDNANVYADLETWSPEPCKLCYCDKGTAVCKDVVCDDLGDCENTVVPDGECCPVCTAGAPTSPPSVEPTGGNPLRHLDILTPTMMA